MSQRLGQLSFDHIYTTYMGGDKFTSRKFVKFAHVEIDKDQYRFMVDSRRLPRGRGINEMAMIQDEVIMSLGFTIGKPVSYHIEPGIGLWFLVDREHGIGNIPTLVNYSDVANAVNRVRPLKIPLGMSAGRQITTIDFDRDTSAHFIVGGTTGGGKSSALHTIICSLINNPPDVVQLMLFDFKRVEFKPFYSGLPHLMDDIVVDPDHFADKITAIAQVADDRYRMMESAGLTHIKKYNASVPRSSRWPYIIIVVDELGRVMEDDTIKNKKQIVKAIADISSVGRAAGIHMVLSTQRPSRVVLPGLIRQCCPGRIGFACASTSESIIIIGNGDLAFKTTAPAGRSILAYGRVRLPIQVAWLSEDMRRSIVSDVISGRNVKSMLTHDVTVSELSNYALEHMDGFFKIWPLYEQFKDRGITRIEISDMRTTYESEPFTIGDDQYIFQRGSRKKAHRIVKYSEVENVAG